MSEVIGHFLPLAITIAISPIPLVGLTVILTSKRGATGGLALTLGWLLGIFIPVAIFASASGQADVEESTASGGIQVGGLILAALMLWLSYRSFSGRPAPGQEAAEPKWLHSLDSLSLFKIFLLGAALVVLNLKNLPLIAQATAIIGLSDLSGGGRIVAAVIFAVLSTLTAIIIVAIAMFSKNSDAILQRARHWLIQHNAVVMGTLFGVLGIVQLGKALGG